jgi:predicted Zn-dependent protease
MQAVVAGSQAAVLQGQLNFSRDVEREADRIGFQMLTAAGFAPSGMASMFEKMDISTRLNDYGSYPYLRSHPLTVERIGESRARLGAAPPVALAGQPSVFEHAAAQARSRVLMDARNDALRKWQARDAVVEGSPTERFLAAFEAAQASSALRDWSRADRGFARAREILRAQPGEAGGRTERMVALSQAQSQIDRSASAEALALLRPWADDGSRPVLLLVAAATLRAATPDRRALETRASELSTWVANHPSDALAWSSLGQTWTRLGQPLRALRAEAESRYALGDLTGALDRLRAGQRAARSAGGAAGGDFIDASVIDSRFRAIEAERKMAMADRQLTR